MLGISGIDVPFVYCPVGLALVKSIELAHLGIWAVWVSEGVIMWQLLAAITNVQKGFIPKC